MHSFLTQLLFSLIGRRATYRIGRALYQKARGDARNDIASPWYEGPSGGDGVNAAFNRIYVIVVSKSWLWILNTDGSAAYQMPRAGTQVQINP